MSGLELTCDDLRRILVAMARDVRNHVDELRDLDAALGDGDLGVTMGLASDAIIQAESVGSEDDVGLMLAELGMSINRKSPSTFGTLLASAFIGAGTAVRGRQTVGPQDLVSMGSGAIEGIKRRGKAEVGEKTMLDSLVPAVEAFQQRLGERMDLGGVFREAVTASGEGVEATKAMIAERGRGRWRRDESVGVQDAGATAVHYLIDSFARHAVEHLA